jgi:hypothetical protein
VRCRQGRQLGDDDPPAFVAQAGEPGACGLRQSRFEEDQRGAAVLDELGENRLDPLLVGVGMDLGTDQAEAVGQCCAGEHDESRAGGGVRLCCHDSSP